MLVNDRLPLNWSRIRHSKNKKTTMPIITVTMWAGVWCLNKTPRKLLRIDIYLKIWKNTTF